MRRGLARAALLLAGLLLTAGAPKAVDDPLRSASAADPRPAATTAPVEERRVPKAAGGDAQANLLVDVARLIPDLVLDLRYATPHNFVGEAFYPPTARCLLLRKTALRLQEVAARLREQDGTRLRVFDCYRPHAVQVALWKRFPKKGYVAHPKGGSVHNRGGAVDLTLASAAGEALPMPTDFDEFTRRAWHSYAGGTPDERTNRARLRDAMKAAGFRTVKMEWWHFEDPEARRAPLLDVPFDAKARVQDG